MKEKNAVDVSEKKKPSRRFMNLSMLNVFFHISDRGPQSRSFKFCGWLPTNCQ